MLAGWRTPLAQPSKTLCRWKISTRCPGPSRTDNNGPCIESLWTGHERKDSRARAEIAHLLPEKRRKKPPRTADAPGSKVSRSSTTLVYSKKRLWSRLRGLRNRCRAHLDTATISDRLQDWSAVVPTAAMFVRSSAQDLT